MSQKVSCKQDDSAWDRAAATCLVAVDGGVATVGGVSIVLRSAAVLHSVSLPPLQSDTHTQASVCRSKWWQSCDNGSVVVVGLPGHGLDLQPLLYAVRKGLLVVVFADTGQYSLLVGFILITAGIDLA